ncbi:hypothetical protein GA707_01820 [Nostocoides sp. F2B08]|uniref:hypothetical protein n=1 Tax=Nostocoides sp. F2B08 TaxID=2653936 RepID=UPI001262DAD7|nr:hypothetical protein [Tetrasphaera sp. F2B08]KAB7746279.1 hypothetical protein GA707_01820 [Tetrasphaera sp. F2B08]
MITPLSRMLGVALVLIGLLWTGQGLGWIGGSFMTGAVVWAVIGPLTALAGTVLIVRGGRGESP